MYSQRRLGPASCLAISVLLLICSAQWASAQLNLLHSFSGANDGSSPAGLAIDGLGNLYGTATQGGSNGTGVEYILKPVAGAWKYNLVRYFPAVSQANGPGYPLRDPHGNIFGTLASGGTYGNGAVFELSPVNGKWSYQLIFSFAGGANGADPSPALAMDTHGNLFGTTVKGGDTSCAATGCGTIFELTPHAGNRWTQAVIYTFTNAPGQEGASPSSGVSLDSAGNLYGVTFAGGTGVCIGLVFGCGVVYQLAPSSSGWQYNVVYEFVGGSDGSFPTGGIAFDAAGNLYGATASGGGARSAGTVFQIAPVGGGGWNYNVIYTFQAGKDGQNVFNPVTVDASGNVYGTAGGGANGLGVLFENVQSSPGNWTYTVLHTFAGGNDGANPSGNLILGAKGVLYGTTLTGGGAKNAGMTYAMKISAAE